MVGFGTPPNLRQNIDPKGVTSKIFKNKDLARLSAQFPWKSAVFRSGWMAAVASIIVFQRATAWGRCLSASWEAGTQIMIVAHGAVDVCDGVHSGFVMKKIGRLGCGDARGTHSSQRTR